MAHLNIVEATIDELQAALKSGKLTSVELVACYLRRIGEFDCGEASLNSIPVLNLSIFDEAAESDDRRAAGIQTRALEGIPYTVKDSYKVRDMMVACGSPAFEHLTAKEDAFTVQAIRAAGGVLIGRTNMPSMAYGGMQRGIYGRAESPYNSKYLAAAFASGSSNGSAVATAASMAAFGMGEETVSSGRSPASNNGLIAYTPSRGWLSIRGNWPLYMMCDVVVPHSRTIQDMLALLDVIKAEDPITDGDFWRDQPYVDLEKPWSDAPPSLRDLGSFTSLAGLRIAVPTMYIGGEVPYGATPVTTSPEVVELWNQAKIDLERLGAEVILVSDFPAVTGYERPKLLPDGCPRLPNHWLSTERGPLIAHGWNDFLVHNKDPKMPDIDAVDTMDIYPSSLLEPTEGKVMDVINRIRFAELARYVKASPLYGIENLDKTTEALEGMRKRLLEDWLDNLGCDCVVFPAAGDVGAADADVNDDSAAYAWRNGVYYSTGNRAIRHLGIPTVSVPMGIMKTKKMPVNLTFAGRAYDDVNLLKYANAYERGTKNRIAPPLTPPLETDVIELAGDASIARPILTVEKCIAEQRSAEDPLTLRVCLEGTIEVTAVGACSKSDSLPKLELIIDSSTVAPDDVKIQRQEGSKAQFRFTALVETRRKDRTKDRSCTLAPVAKDKVMVILLARSQLGGIEFENGKGNFEDTLAGVLELVVGTGVEKIAVKYGVMIAQWTKLGISKQPEY